VTKMTKATRKDRIYLDYLRNDREATSVAPIRREPGAVPCGDALAMERIERNEGAAFHVTDFETWKARLRRIHGPRCSRKGKAEWQGYPMQVLTSPHCDAANLHVPGAERDNSRIRNPRRLQSSRDFNL